MNHLINFFQEYLKNENGITKLSFFMATIFGTFVISKIAQVMLSKYLKDSIRCDLDKKHCTSVCMPMTLIVWITGIDIALNSIDLSIPRAIKQLMNVSLIFFITWLIFNLIEILGNFLTQKYNDKEKDTLILQFFPLINKVLKALIAFIAVIVAMQANGYSAASLLTGFGVMGMAVGIAAKETIANFFGSFAVVMDSVYKQGDFIAIDKTLNGNHVEGCVEEINLRSTKIRAIDDTLLIIPNNIMANITIKNISRQNKKLLNESIEIALEAGPQKIEQALEICRKIIASNSELYENARVNLNKINAATCQINIFAFTKTTEISEFLKLKNALLLAIINELKKIGVFEYIKFQDIN